MKEYKVEYVGGIFQKKDAEKIMNARAEEGWEVLSTAYNSETAKFIITFAREKQESGKETD